MRVKLDRSSTTNQYVHNIWCTYTYLNAVLLGVVQQPYTLIGMHNPSVNDTPTISLSSPLSRTNTSLESIVYVNPIITHLYIRY